jgi:hypothetical protein
VSCLIVFLILLIYFSKLSRTSRQPISVADFGRGGNPVKLVNIITSTKSVFIKFQFWGFGGGGAAARQRQSLGAPLGLKMAD